MLIFLSLFNCHFFLCDAWNHVSSDDQVSPSQNGAAGASAAAGGGSDSSDGTANNASGGQSNSANTGDKAPKEEGGVTEPPSSPLQLSGGRLVVSSSVSSVSTPSVSAIKDLSKDLSKDPDLAHRLPVSFVPNAVQQVQYIVLC